MFSKRKLLEILQQTSLTPIQLTEVFQRIKVTSLNMLMGLDLFSESLVLGHLAPLLEFTSRNTVKILIKTLLKLLKKFQIEH